MYYQAARELGAVVAQAGYTLVYGGGKVGLMGALARSVHENGGRVVAVVPEKLRPQLYAEADEIVVTRDMRERKAVMEERSDAFVGLPGGFGTLEEVLEVVTLKQLQFHRKAIVLMNTDGFYDPLVGVFEHFYRKRFVKPIFRQLYHVAPDAEAVISYLGSYQMPELDSKWFEDKLAGGTIEGT